LPTPRVVLHIGRQKTGTSSIQRFLAANASALAEEGILYPETGRLGGRHIAHHELATALNERESDGSALAELQGRFRAEIGSSPHPVVVLSSEAFQRVHDFGRLRRFFGASRPYVVCYLRECLAAKQSSWAQALQATSQNAAFLDFATGRRFAYQRFAAGWRRFADELDLALYERERLRDGDIVADFLTRIGHVSLANRLGSLVRDDGSPSLGGNLLHLRRVMNVARAGRPDPRGTFESLSTLAASEPRWRGRWRVTALERAAIDRVDRDDARYLEGVFGEIRREDFDLLPPMPELATLAEDTTRILSEPIIAEGFAALGLRAGVR